MDRVGRDVGTGYVDAVRRPVAVVLREKPDPDEELLARVPLSDIYASGRFSGYVDLGGGRPGEQLDDATVEEALERGRTRAEVVLIQFVRQRSALLRRLEESQS